MGSSVPLKAKYNTIRKQDKTFEVLKSFYMSTFFQKPRSTFPKGFFVKFRITLEDLKEFLENSNFSGGSKSKIEKYKKLIKTQNLDTPVY